MPSNGWIMVQARTTLIEHTHEGKEQDLVWPPSALYVALIPASRRQEVHLVWPVMAEAALLVREEMHR